MVILRPMTHDGCFSARSTVISANSSLGVCAKRSAGSGKPKVAHGDWRFAVETLKNGRVFAVDRQNAHAMLARFAHDDFAGHDENFLRGHGDVFARANRRQRRLQSSRADDGDEHDVRRWQGGQFDQALRRPQ